MRHKQHNAVTSGDKCVHSLFVAEVSPDVFDFAQMWVVETVRASQKSISGKCATWQAFLLKVPGQVKANETGAADDSDHKSMLLKFNSPPDQHIVRPFLW